MLVADRPPVALRLLVGSSWLRLLGGGVAARSSFELSSAMGYADRQYGLICFFDCLHDLGGPEAAARHAVEVLAPAVP